MPVVALSGLQAGHLSPARPSPLMAALALPLCLAFLLPGCARTGAGPSEERLLVDRHLEDAADAITRDLAAMNGSAQEAGALPADGSPLRAVGTLLYDGPLEGALARACAATGFRLVVLGDPPDVPPVAHVHASGVPWISVFRAIGRQTGPLERVRLLEAARVVELAYLDGKTGQPRREGAAAADAAPGSRPGLPPADR